MDNSKPLVSICMISYNHEPYIAQAIESVLMQVGDFSIELVIGEDFSKDRTRAICLEYEGKYPDKIRLLKRNSNVGASINFVDTLQNCHGKYVAILEGDDYWTDRFKLQKQVNFLEANSSFSMCFHDVEDLYADGKFGQATYCSGLGKDTFDIYDETAFVNIPTLSVLFRNRVFKLPNDFTEMAIGDWPLFMLLSEKGDFKYLDEVMGVYRKHQGGVNSVVPAFVQNANKTKAIEKVIGWFRDKKRYDVVERLQAQLSKSYYYQSVLYLQNNNKKESFSFYRKLLTQTPLMAGLNYKLKYPIKYLTS